MVRREPVRLLFETVSMKYLIFLFSAICCGCGTHPLEEWDDPPQSVPMHIGMPPAAGSSVTGRTDNDGLKIEAPDDTALRGPVSLDELLRIADERNPRIAAVRAAMGVAASRRWQAEIYPNPSVEFETEETGRADGGGTRGIGTVAFVQPIPVGTSRGAAIEAASAEQRAKIADLDAVRLEVLGELRERYVELLFVRRSMALNEELADIVDQAVQIAKARFKVQASPEAELIKAQVEAARLHLDRTTLEEAQNVALARMTSLLGGVAVRADQITDQSLESPGYEQLDALRLRLLDAHPRLAAGRHRIESARQRVTQARGRGFDEVGLRVGYARDYANDDNLLTAGISLPLPLFDRGQAKVLEARYHVIEKIKELQIIRDQLMEELTIAWHAYQSAGKRLDEQRQQIVEPSERAWAQTQAGYKTGNFSFLDLLDAQRTLTDARSVELELVRDVYLAEARIWKLLGPFGHKGREAIQESKNKE